MKTLINKIKLLSNDQNPESIKLLIDSLTELGDLKLAKSPKSIEQYTDAAIFYQHAFVISTRYLKDSVPEVSKKLQQVNGAVGKLLNIEELLLETESYKKILKELRDFVKKKIDNIEFDNLDPDVIKDLFHNISTKMRENIVAKLFKSSEGEIGTAPCKYSVIGLGSLALNQATPYSDLEFAILTENEEYKKDPKTADYFKNLAHLVNLKIINLGETSVPRNYGIDLNHFIHKGVMLDPGGKTPLGEKDKNGSEKYCLIQTIDGMIKYLKNEDEHASKIDKNLSRILEKTCHIYGNKELTKEYQLEVNNFLFLDDKCQHRAIQTLAPSS